MLSSDGNKNSQKNAVDLISKNQLCTCSILFCTFLCRCFVRLHRETSRNFLVTCFIEEMLYVFLFTFFFTATHFLTVAI